MPREEDGDAFLNRVRAALAPLAPDLAPEVAGRSVEECERLLREAVMRIIEDLGLTEEPEEECTQ